MGDVVTRNVSVIDLTVFLVSLGIVCFYNLYEFDVTCLSEFSF